MTADDLRREIVRRVMARLDAAGVGGSSPGEPHDVDSLPPSLRGSAEGRWDDVDPAIGFTSPTTGPDAGHCRGCTLAGTCAWTCAATTRTLAVEGAERIGATLGARSVGAPMASRIDHTLLRPDATSTEITSLCEEAIRYRFASVCVNGSWVKTVSDLLRGHDVLTCAVVGFPLGASESSTKAAEARQAVSDGATEIDMVMCIGSLKAGDYHRVADDIAGVVDASGVPVKVILETALLDDEEIIEACTLAKAAGAEFVKTSTGFGPSGATVDAVRLMRRIVGDDMSVKASGGIRDADVAQSMIEAGADRIGASASVRIATDAA